MNFSYDGVANTTVERSTIAANSAFNGGGIANRSRVIFEDASIANLSVRGSTISGNTATASGAGIHSQGEYGGEAQADILNTTITGNTANGLDGGGIRAVDTPESSTVIRSTIVAGNTAARDGDDLFGQSISGTFNLVGDPVGHSFVDGVDHNLVGIDPRLGPLADNGGPTETHLLLDTSPAIDQGTNSLSLATDQRGSAFLRTVDFPAIGNASDGTDIGAVEIGQVASTFDYGDAPDGVSVGDQLRQYPTKSASDGARHRIDTFGPFLGRIRPDAESDGQASAMANGDDLLGSDDEDSFPSGPIQLTPGQPIDGVIIAYDGSTSGAFLNVWLDVNLDGDWSDDGEHLIVDRSVPAGAGNTSLSTITLPANAGVGTSFLRARISTQSGLLPTGQASDGEVEDVQVLIGDVPVETADLSLQQVVDNLNPVIGDVVNFTITITNDGPDRATDVEVTNLLPPELFFQQATVTKGTYEFEETWFLDFLAPGESAELRIRASVESSDTAVHTAEITFADQFDPDSTPGNGVSGEDDQATVTLGTCLSAGPLHVGLNRVTFSCASPGAWVGFVHGTIRGSKTFDQYNVTVDIADAEGVAIALADLQGIASASIYLSEEDLAAAVDGLGDPRIVQAFEMLPRRTKSNTLAINTEVAMLRASAVGSGGDVIGDELVQTIAAAARRRWSALPLSSALRQRLERARIVISDLPGDALARVVGRTIVVDKDAAGNGWYVDPSPLDDREYRRSGSTSRLDATEPTPTRRIDLLTTLMHEFGHVLGLPDLSNPDNVMHRRLEKGIRRLPVPNTNDVQSLDVNRDQRVTALDALQIVNWLGRRELSSNTVDLPWLGEGGTETLFLDTNSDFRVSAFDALLIINHMSRSRSAENEAVAATQILDSTQEIETDSDADQEGTRAVPSETPAKLRDAPVGRNMPMETRSEELRNEGESYLGLLDEALREISSEMDRLGLA